MCGPSVDVEGAKSVLYILKPTIISLGFFFGDQSQVGCQLTYSKYSKEYRRGLSTQLCGVLVLNVRMEEASLRVWGRLVRKSFIRGGYFGDEDIGNDRIKG